MQNSFVEFNRSATGELKRREVVGSCFIVDNSQCNSQNTLASRCLNNLPRSEKSLF